MLKSLNPLLKEPFTKIAENLANFKIRSGQLQMMQAVFETLQASIDSSEEEELPPRLGESILVIEGPTGTGKSLGYLLPAIIASKIKQKRLIISSATVMLQEQLAKKDIPFFAEKAGLSVSYIIAKGRSRYVCPARLHQIIDPVQQSDWVGQDQELTPWSKDPNFSEVQLLKKLADGFDNESWSGDRDSLEIPVPDYLWNRVTNDRHGCLKKDCPYFKKCPFFVARAKLEQTDIIIVNHDLLLADLSMGGGVILPALEDSFYCIDEAHHLSDKAIQQFAGSHALNGTLKWLEKIPTLVAKAESILKESKWYAKISDATETIAGILQDVRNALSSLPELRFFSNPFAKDSTKIYRGLNSELPAGFNIFCKSIIPVINALLMALQLLQDTLRKSKSKIEFRSQEALLDRFIINIGFFTARIGNLAAVWNLLHTNVSDEQPPIAKWFTAEYSNKEVEYYLHASPVRVGHILAQKFWRLAAGVILTSATLRALGKFEKILEETGLKNFPKTSCVALRSPFDFSKQGILSIPNMKFDPSNVKDHLSEVIRLLPQLMNSSLAEGVLVLFAAKKQMQEVVNHLRPDLRAKLLVQGDKPKEILIKEHFERITKNQFSALFGLASFAEGLDLPGKTCTHVIIIKIPFAVPDDPVGLTLAEWVARRGGKPFLDIVLPDASIKLIQAVGRLIRSETDTGKVSILDNRMLTKFYGKTLLASLPPFRFVGSSPEHIITHKLEGFEK